MKIIERIKDDVKIAMKSGEKVKKLALSTLVAEIQRNEPTMENGEKTWSDEQCIATIKKVIEGNEICENYEENEFFLIYLPKKLSSVKVMKIILDHIQENDYSGMKDMGKVMNFLKDNYSGQYDGKMASETVRSYLMEQ